MELIFVLSLCLMMNHVRGAIIALSELTFQDTCDEKYKNIYKYHSMCLTQVGEVTPVTQEMKDAIVDKHNELRRNVNPSAENMRKMYWNDDLALAAERWAQHCKEGHDTGAARKMPNIPIVGQNGAFGIRDFESAITAWHAEVKDFQYGERLYATFHYTQVVQAVSDLVGCGMAKCSGTTHIICNYAQGNMNTSHPYLSGTKCAACPNSCSNGLCDCKGKFCYNYGDLDVDACDCKCKAMFKGDRCETKDCTGVVKKSWCYSSQFSAEGICDRFSNFPYDCPIKCGTCPPPCDGKECKNNGKLNLETCECQCFPPFSGPTCENKDCSKVTDMSYCNDATNCRYTFYKQKCPIMCDYCPKN